MTTPAVEARTELHRSDGVVHTDPDRLRRLVLTARSGPVGDGNCWLLGVTTGSLTGGPPQFTAELAGHAMTVDVSADTIAFQGGWWYRGEWTVGEHEDGALLTHRVRNVANRLRWGVPLANRFFVGFDARTREHVAATLTRIGRALDCEARLLDG